MFKFDFYQHHNRQHVFKTTMDDPFKTIISISNRQYIGLGETQQAAKQQAAIKYVSISP